MQKKKPVSGKTKKINGRKFEVEKGNEAGEFDLTIELFEDGDYTVEKLELDDLPKTMPDGRSIQWFNNFLIKRNGNPLKQRYSVTIPGIGNTKVVVYDSAEKLTEVEAVNGRIELTDGDPGIGKTT